MKLQSPLLVGVIILAGLLCVDRGGHQQADGQLAALEHSASAYWAVELNIKPDTVAVGDLDMAVSIRSARSGYLTILQRGTDGKEDIVFPNALDQDNRIEAGKPLKLPRGHWKLRATPPAGEGRLLALVTERPLDPQGVQVSLSGAQPIDLGVRPYGAASATYRERE